MSRAAGSKRGRGEEEDGDGAARVLRARTSIVDYSHTAALKQQASALSQLAATLKAQQAAAAKHRSQLLKNAKLKAAADKKRLAKMREQREATAADPRRQKPKPKPKPRSRSSYSVRESIASSRAVLCALISLSEGPPAHWEPVDPAHGNKTLVLLSKDNPTHKPELAQVTSRWSRTGGLGTLVSVHRVQNLKLHQRYEAHKRQHKAGHKEITAYHGSSSTPPSTIYKSSTGFDPKFGASLPGHLWFAENASYSSGGYQHYVTSAHLPFGTFNFNFNGLPTAVYGQLFQAKIYVDPKQSMMHNRGQPGVHLISRPQQAVPTHLLTFK